MAHQVRDTSGFAPASHQSLALCLGTLGGSLLLWPIAVWGFPSPFRFIIAWAAVGLGAWLLSRSRWHWRLHELGEGILGSDFGASPAAAELLEGKHIHRDVNRLLNVAKTKFADKLVLDNSAVEFEDDGKGGRKLVGWGFRCEPGYLTDTAVQDKLQKTFQSGLGGFWSFQFNPSRDTFTATKKSNLPRLVFPPLWPVVRGAEEAKKLYLGWKFKIGVAAGGEEIGFSLDKWSHVRIIGETNAGKSVAIQNWMEQFRAAGWMLILGDGKGQDYVGYSNPNPDDHNLPVPGTIAAGSGASTRGMGYVGAIVTAYQIMQERQLSSEQDKIDNPAGWNMYPPVLLVLDEIKGMREKWKTALSGDEQKSVESMITQLLALGRAFRVHVVLLSQDAYVDSMPSMWTSNTPLAICLGKPKDNTVQKAFEKSVVPKVRQIRESMDPEIKGRGLFASVDPITGASDAMEYQGYLSYAPGESWDNPKIPSQAAKEWPKFKEQVSDKVPRLWTRMWFRIDHKSEAQRGAETAGEPDLGYIDFDQFSPAEILRMERVALDTRGASGEIVPNPDMAKYDPCSPLYVCKAPLGSRRVLNPEL